jgi:hypothetical protein
VTADREERKAMKARAWLGTVSVLFLVRLAAAGEGLVEVQAPAGTPSRELGVLAPVQAEARLVVPKDGLWQAPESSFVCAESISVQPERGPALVRREREPRQGQFSSRSGGVLIFSAADVGRRFAVHYQFRPRRVALLEATAPTDYADAPALLAEVLAEELGKHGFVVVPAREVRDAAAALGLGTISPRALPSPEKLTALAQEVSAAYVLLPDIGIREHSGPGEFDTGIPIPQEKDRPPSSAFYEEPTLVLPTTRYRLYGVVRLAIVEGATGTVVGDETTSGSQRVRSRRFSSARRSLLRSLATQVVAAWREPAGSTAPR